MTMRDEVLVLETVIPRALDAPVAAFSDPAWSG